LVAQAREGRHDAVGEARDDVAARVLERLGGVLLERALVRLRGVGRELVEIGADLPRRARRSEGVAAGAAVRRVELLAGGGIALADASRLWKGAYDGLGRRRHHALAAATGGDERHE